MVSAIQSPAYTPEDRALLLGLAQYEAGLCHGCKQPREIAWHAEMDGWYETESFVCHACTARSADGHKAVYRVALDSRDPSAPALPPFVLGETTTSD